MNEPTLDAIVDELAEELEGAKFGKIFLVEKLRLFIDFRRRDERVLQISLSPGSLSIYLSKQDFRTLDKVSLPPTSFVMQMRKTLGNARVENIEKVPNERIVKFDFLATDEFGKTQNPTLAIQLTGRSSNLFLLDSDSKILGSIRRTHGYGQEISDEYIAPERTESSQIKTRAQFPKGDFSSLSQALDAYFTRKRSNANLAHTVAEVRKNLNSKLSSNERLKKHLYKDIEKHGSPEQWKKFGDLLLANVYDAERKGDYIIVKDFFAEGTPKIEIPGDANSNITEIAEGYFRRYTKARNARTELSARISSLEETISSLKAKRALLEAAIESENYDVVETFLPPKQKYNGDIKSKKAETTEHKHARIFLSSDGYEILVGKRSKDNDILTFRIARSNDVWLHAADYPGSHVIIRAKSRAEVPQTTLHEAAQLAAFYSKARDEKKAAVNFTQRKFVSKPKASAPGLVSLSSFKTLFVEPQVPV
ncbi:MAG: NFACT family protein [Pyrinomonadaceae bacterium]